MVRQQNHPPQKEINSMTQIIVAEDSSSNWNSLYRVGGVAALMAGIIFRRNLGAEISLFAIQKQPETISAWFTLLHNNRFLGLSYLNIFDLANYALVGVMFLSLLIVLRQANKSYMTIAAAFGFLGIAVYFASNTALSMLSLSDQYAAATTEAQRASLLASGQATLALNRFSSPGAHPGAGGYLSLLLIAVAGMMISIIMLRSHVFNRVTAYVGILASALDLAYCMTYAFIPAVDVALLAIYFIPAAGLFWMVWHILIGQRLYQMGRLAKKSLSTES